MHIHMSQKEVSLVMPQIKQFRVINDSELCEVFIPDIYQHTIQRDEIKMVFYAKFRHLPQCLSNNYISQPDCVTNKQR